MNRLRDWLAHNWHRVLRVGGLALALSALSQLVLGAASFRHHAAYLDLLAAQAWQGWLLSTAWATALGLRWWRDREGSEPILESSPGFGLALTAVLVGVVSPFMSPYFTHLTHPLLAAWVAWTGWPFLRAAQQRVGRGVGPLAQRPVASRAVPWLIAGIGAGLFFVQSYRRHFWFGSGGKDLGLFHQSVWLLSRFEAPHNTVLGMHAFADHLEFIDLLAVPTQWLWPSASSLLLMQAVVVALGTVPIHQLAELKLGSRLAAASLAIAFLVATDIQNGIMFDWNPTTIGAGIIPWVVWTYERERPIAFGIALALLALCKENLVLYALGICLALATGPRKRLPLAAAAVLGVWFVVEMKLILPVFRADGFRHLRYEALGSSASEIVASVLRSPYRAVSLLFTPGAKINGLLAPFSSVAFACFLAPRWTLAFAAPVLERFWSSHANRWWGHHYGAGIGAIAVVAAVYGLERVKRSVSEADLLRVAAVTVLLAALAISALARWGPGPVWVWRHTYYASAEDREDATAVLAIIPDDASVAAQNHLLPHLSGRRQIYQVTGPSHDDYVDPTAAQFVALDLAQSAWPEDRGYPRGVAKRLLEGDYGVVACLGTAVVLQRGAASVDCPALGVKAEAP